MGAQNGKENDVSTISSDKALRVGIDELQQTKLILNGYFRSAFPTFLVPTDIIHLTSSFVTDHFMLTTITYRWNIDNDKLKDMKQANVGQVFSSDIFHFADMDWIIHVYPNGNTVNNKGNFQSFLRIASEPIRFNLILVCCRIACIETSSSFTWMSDFSKSKYHGCGPSMNAIKLTEIKSFSTLSLEATIRMNRLRLKDSNALHYQRQISVPTRMNFEWEIDKDSLFRMKLSHNGKVFSSPIYYDAFCMDIYPNGLTAIDEGCTLIYLLLLTLPPHASEIQAKWKIRVTGSNSSGKTVTADGDAFRCRFNADSGYGFSWGTSKLSFGEFKQLSDVTIQAQLMGK